MSTVGLVLTGGGARSAYQAGALLAIAEITKSRGNPFSVLTGVSAGAINCAVLAGRADDFAAATDRLAHTWRTLTPDQVYRTDARSLLAIGARWLRDLSSGGLMQHGANHLLDTSPLRSLLDKVIEVPQIEGHLSRGKLRCVAVSSTNYMTGTATTFFDGDPAVASWSRSRRLGIRTRLGLEHVLASSAIPVFFAPVEVHGAYHGDGCIRLTAPLSPAIHLGADRVLAIGLRYLRSDDETSSINANADCRVPTLSEISGVLLNSVFLDSLDSDVERLERINKTVSLIPKAGSTLRPIPALVLRPSVDLATLVRDQAERLPPALKYLMRGIGVRGETGSDLLSYLAFDGPYMKALMDLGHRDTIARADEVRRFLAA